MKLNKRLVVVSIVMAGLLGGALRAAYEGPVPAPTDAYGRAGAYAVTTETLPSPRWEGQVVTVFFPQGAEGKRPVWFFSHGFGGSDVAHYRELLTHLASHGAVVVFSPYPASEGGRPADAYATLHDGFVAAAERFADRMDLSRVGFGGHSYGGGATPSIALRGVRERGWGSAGLALFILAPWYSYQLTDADLASFPAYTQAVVQVYEDDAINDHRMAIDLFTRLALPAASKDYLMVRSDRIEGYNYPASHRVPTGGSRPDSGVTAFDALDAWGVLRIAQALTASALGGDEAARAVALGDGGAEQVRMGATAAGRALRTMEATDRPTPLFAEGRYAFGWSRPANPRRAAALPAPVARVRLGNLSARGRSGGGADVLTVGAAVQGARPKTLLLRAVGPGLRPFGLRSEELVADPRLSVFRGAALDLENDNWGEAIDSEALAAMMAVAGTFPLAEGSKDAALLASFAPGTLTAQAGTGAGGAGIALIELYDGEVDGGAWLANLSARAHVGEGAETLIAGVTVTGPGALRVLVRGVGPGLAPFGVEGTLGAARLEVFRGAARIGSNEGWSREATAAAELASAAAQVGAFALEAGSGDAALILTLPAGGYTVQLTPRDGRAGRGLIELYVLP